MNVLNKALLTFSNGESLELHEDQSIATIMSTDSDEDTHVSPGRTHTLEYDLEYGLFLSITKLLCKCIFFYSTDNENKIYKSSAVFSIENL